MGLPEKAVTGIGPVQCKTDSLMKTPAQPSSNQKQKKAARESNLRRLWNKQKTENEVLPGLVR